MRKADLLRAAACAIILPLPSLAAGAGAGYAPDFSLEDYRPLVADLKAHVVGDTVQILIIESTQAESSAGTGSTSNTALSAAGNADESDAGGKLGISGDTKGNGQTTRSGSVRSIVTARVINITEEGNLVLEANQEVVINDEAQRIHVNGVARPLDITSENYVPSNRLANATITIDGVGAIANAQRQGIVFRFLKWLRIL